MILRLLRAVIGPLVPARWKVPTPCPPLYLADRRDRFAPVFVGVAAALQLLTGVDALAIELVFGRTTAATYLVLLIAYGIVALAATCVITLGVVLRAWGATVCLLASAALTRWVLAATGMTDADVGSPIVPVAFYLGWGAVEIIRGQRLVNLGRDLDPTCSS